MAIPRTVKRHLEGGNFDALEEEWLEHASRAPEDVDFFVGVARALAGTGESDRARLLLELLDGQLTERGLWRERLTLLRRSAGLPLEPRWVHDQALSTLERLHAGSSILQPLVEKVGLHRAVDDLAKTVEKLGRLDELLRFDRGAIVAMSGQGVGKVVDVNFELEAFRIELETRQSVTVSFRAAGKLLKPLPAGHFLRRKVEEPAAVAALALRDPGATLGELLASQGQPMTAAEIRQALAGLVPEPRWTAWWTAARRHPQVVVRGSGRQSYAWAGSAEDAVDAVWEAFAQGDRPEKLQIFRRSAGRFPELAKRMATALADLGGRLAARDPAAALEIWDVLEREGSLVPDSSFSPAFLIASAPDPVALILAGDDRQIRERALLTVREHRPDWAAVYLELLEREADPRLLDLLANALSEANPEGLERAISRILSRPRYHAATIIWLVERAAWDERLRGKRPLLLLQHILHAPAWDEMAPFRTRLKALWHPGGTVSRLLPLLDAQEAERAEAAIQRAAGLSEYERQPLINALHLRFPELRRAEHPLYALEASIAEHRAQLQDLVEREIPANRRAIEEARAHGDLRENFEYKSARQRHEYLSARVAELQRELARARPLDLSRVDTSEVRAGCRVELQSEDGAEETRTITVLGPWESRPEEGIVSYESDVGGGLLGLKVGDVIAFEGRDWRLARIERAEPGRGAPADPDPR